MIEDIMKAAGNPAPVQEKPVEAVPAGVPYTPAATKPAPTNVGQESIPAWAQQLMSQNEEMRAKIKMFEDMAGKNDIASYMDRQRDFSKKTVYFKKHNGKIVVAWSNLDYSKFNPQSRDALNENILTTVTYLDGSKEEVNFIVLDRTRDMIKVPIVEMGTELVKVEWPAEVVEEYKLADKVMSVEIKFANR